MKKFTKICIAAGVICMVAGGVVAAVSMIMGAASGSWLERGSEAGRRLEEWWGVRSHGYPFERLSDDYLDDRVVFGTDMVRNLHLESDWGDVIVLTGAGTDTVEVYSNAPKDYWNCHLEYDTLNVAVRPKTLDFSDYTGGVVFIEVPEDFSFSQVDLEINKEDRFRWGRKDNAPYVEVDSLDAQSLKAEVDNGTLVFTEGEFGSLDLQLDVGVIQADQIRAEELSAGCDVGTIELHGQVTGNIEAEVDVGSLEMILEGEPSDYNYKLNSSLGSITIDGVSYGGLERSRWIDNNAPREMDLGCDVGSVNIEFQEN